MPSQHIYKTDLKKSPEVLVQVSAKYILLIGELDLLHEEPKVDHYRLLLDLVVVHFQEANWLCSHVLLCISLIMSSKNENIIQSDECTPWFILGRTDVIGS